MKKFRKLYRNYREQTRDIFLQTADMRAAHPLHISVGSSCGNTRRMNYFVQI